MVVCTVVQLKLWCKKPRKYESNYTCVYLEDLFEKKNYSYNKCKLAVNHSTKKAFRRESRKNSHFLSNKSDFQYILLMTPLTKKQRFPLTGLGMRNCE